MNTLLSALRGQSSVARRSRLSARMAEVLACAVCSGMLVVNLGIARADDESAPDQPAAAQQQTAPAATPRQESEERPVAEASSSSPEKQQAANPEQGTALNVAMMLGSLTPEHMRQLGQMLEQDWKDRPEWGDMTIALLKGESMRSGMGWWKPTAKRYDWDWLRGRFDTNQDGKVSRDEFTSTLSVSQPEGQPAQGPEQNAASGTEPPKIDPASRENPETTDPNTAAPKPGEPENLKPEPAATPAATSQSPAEPAGSRPAKLLSAELMFDRLDRDLSGDLTAADLDWSDPRGMTPAAMQARMLDMLFYRLDTDSNGRITTEELAEFFIRADRDELGFLTPEDLRLGLDDPESRRTPAAAHGPPPPSEMIRMFLTGQLGVFEAGPELGQAAPEFVLPTHDGSATITLTASRGKRPVVLIFGSFT